MIDPGFDLPDEVFGRLYHPNFGMRAFRILSLEIESAVDRRVCAALWRHGVVAAPIIVDGRYWREPLDGENSIDGLIVPAADSDGDDAVTDLIGITNTATASLMGETAAFGTFRPAPEWWRPDASPGQLDIFTGGRQWLDRYVENARRMLMKDGPSPAVAKLLPPIGEFETLVLQPNRLEWTVHSTVSVIPENVTRVVCPDSIALATFIRRNIARPLRCAPAVVVPTTRAP